LRLDYFIVQSNLYYLGQRKSGLIRQVTS